MQESVIYQDILKTEAVTFANRLIKRRFGEIAPALEGQIRELSREKLELLGEALFDLATIDDLTAWLADRAG